MSPEAASAIQRELWLVTVPWDRAIRSPGGEHGATYALVVRLRDSEAREGIGYAYGLSPSAIARFGENALGLAPSNTCTLTELLAVERRDDQRSQTSGASRSAACALSMAAWDLLGKQRGMRCAELWGGSPARKTIDAYASGLFLGSAIDDLLQDARQHRGQGFTNVKMRGGLSPKEDGARYAAVCSVFPEPGSVAVDFWSKSTVPAVNEFIAQAATQPLWIEDPTDSAGLGGITARALVAGGESCHSLTQLLALYEAGVRHIILDIQVLGGPLRFLEAARLFHALGCKVGSHTFAHQSPHLLASLPDSMPVEVLDWWNMLFKEPLQPDEHGRLAIQGPGFGVALREETLAAHGTRLSPK
jgi:L-alanine-DL-glutamate epimerase-like enolase superfamily enzyme